MMADDGVMLMEDALRLVAKQIEESTPEILWQIKTCNNAAEIVETWRKKLYDNADLIESLTAQLAEEKITSQTLRIAANGFKAQLAASQRRERDAAGKEVCEN